MEAHAFETALAQKVDAVFRARPDLPDHRQTHPGLTNSLGDPSSAVWFIAEFPTLTRINTAGHSRTSPNAQWNVSLGDRLFREALFEAGFKTGSPGGPGGWQCYITNLVKAADHAGLRKSRRTEQARLADAEAWAPVLHWQLEAGRPRLIVLMGGGVESLLKHLIESRRIALPAPRARIDSYAYVASYPKGKLGPMHPQRVAGYKRSIAAIARRFGLSQHLAA